ncbi:hypothetical protein C8J56DRAFT_250734 [Mycena floridula]|nr:hypothetical protein C8J56DRAFT_250734 [Mycena floridula]
MNTQLHGMNIGNISGGFLSGNTVITHYHPPRWSLRDFARHDAAHNSFQDEREEASVCAPGTREELLGILDGWTRGEDELVCWLHGPAGAGKSTLALTVAKICHDQNRLAFSYFFSKGHPDRSNLAKFIPTFAFELARCLGRSVSSVLSKALESNPRLFHQRFEEQLKSVVAIIHPVLCATKLVEPLVVVIDGLDEYDPDIGQVPITLLIGILIRWLTGKLRLRILFTGRGEADIKDIFVAQHTGIRLLALQDFPAIQDVEKWLRNQLHQVSQKRQIGPHWPSQDAVRSLAQQSQGIFLYASTLVKFVDDSYDDPRRKLEIAIQAHKGLDALFKQVLTDAKRYPNFESVLGATLLLRNQRAQANLISTLLQLESPADVRLALRGCMSIMLVPENDHEIIRPYLASLQDFLEDPQRQLRWEHFFYPMSMNKLILDRCVKVIMGLLNTQRPSWHWQSKTLVDYAYQCWAYHLALKPFKS